MATNAHTSVPSDQKGAFPPFQSETFASQALWLVLTFTILYVLMAKVALPRIGSILGARSGRIADDLAEAARLKDESDAAIAAYEKALADARSRAQAIAGDMRQKQAGEAETARKALEQQLDVKLADAEKQIAGTKAAAMSNVKGIATDAASAIVERLIGTAPAANDVAAAVSDVVKR